MAEVQLQGLSKRYGAAQVVHGIDLHIDDGEFVVLVGPSGCGKSTLMRMIAGLEDISDGELRIGGTRANELSPQRRNVSMVFQSYALYPHLSVHENIAFGPRIRKEARQDYEPRIRAAARMLNLSDYLDRLPRALSGGQRQRVAMGRAIVREPALFLFDEPLSNLDAKLRVQMRTEIKALHQRLRNTVVYVTHDQVEAMTMADRIVVMNAGRIEQIGAPLALYDRPANRFVAGFLGSPAMNFVDGTVEAVRDLPTLRLADGTRVPLPADLPGALAGKRVTLGVRPEEIAWSNGERALRLSVDVVEPTGAETHVYGKLADATWCLTTRDRTIDRPGIELGLALPPEHMHLFDADSGQRLN